MTDLDAFLASRDSMAIVLDASELYLIQRLQVAAVVKMVASRKFHF